YVVLDEAQAIKNSASESAKSAKLLKSRHRLALSGTPVQNHLGELWSLLEFLNPGMLGRSVGPGSAFANAVASVGSNGKDIDGQTRSLLARAVRPFVLRRTKEQVAADLLVKLEQTLYCDLEPPQRKLYDELIEHYSQALLDK